MTATLSPNTSAPVDPKIDTSEVARSTRFRRRAIGTSIVAGSVIAIAGFATTVWEKSDKKIDYLNSLNIHPTQSQIAAVLLHFGYMMFVPVLIALAAMTRRRNVKVGNAGLILGGIGAISLPGALLSDFYDLAIRQSLPNDATAVRVSDKAGSYGLAQLMMFPTLMALMLGITMLLVAAWRANWLPVYLAPAFVVGFLAPAFLGHGWVVNVVPSAVALAALGVVGVRVLRMTDREFATGAHQA